MDILIPIFILGLVHGLTPCEHTWPIISAYAISQRKWHKGFLAAIAFVLPAILPWTLIACICGYLGSVIWKPNYEIYIHLILGSIMIILGLNILNLLKIPYLHLNHYHKKTSKLSLKQLSIYGFILGFGPCAPVLIMYAMSAKFHTIFLGTFSGIFFGIGTMISLSIIGVILGGSLEFIEKRIKGNLPKICSKISGIILILTGAWMLYTCL